MVKSPLKKEFDFVTTERSRLVTVVVLLVGWTFVAFQWQTAEIDRLARTNAAVAAEQLVWLARIAAFGIGVVVITLGAWIWRAGQTACRTERFPVIDTRLTQKELACAGRQAHLIGRFSQVAGLVFLVLGTISAWLLIEFAELTLPK